METVKRFFIILLPMHMNVLICVKFYCMYVYSVYLLFSMINLIQNTFGVKKARPSKVESYLEVNT